MFSAQHDLLQESVRPKLGANDQLFRIDLVEVACGTGRGSQLVSVKNPGGISAEIHVDRGLDIGWADAHGYPLAWRSRTGTVPGDRYNPSGSGWCETFSGGLLATCGLETTGAPDADEGLGLHGRVGHLPAQNVTWGARIVDGEHFLFVSGDVVESRLGGQSLRMSRTLLFATARAQVRVLDEVENLGFRDAEHMFRHHFNLGYPLADESLTLQVPCGVVEDRDGPHCGDVPFRLPLAVSFTPVYEKVWTCWTQSNVPQSTHEGEASIVRHDGSTAVKFEWSGNGFDRLLVWRDPSPGVNVLGIEPSTSGDLGRKASRDDGSVLVLGPQETKNYCTVVTFFD